jgi:hypothetical protein
MDFAQLDAWYSQSQRRAARVGVTRTRAEYFIDIDQISTISITNLSPHKFLIFFA